MPKFNVTLTGQKLNKDGEVPVKPIVVEAADAPAAKIIAVGKLKPEGTQDVEVERVEEAVTA